MTIELHTLKPAHGSRTRKFRIGRGNASGRGTTAGRGTKGQRARAGGRNKLKLKGLKQMLLSFPKNRGFRSRFIKPETVTMTRLVKAFPAAAMVDLQALKHAKLIHPRITSVRLVGTGELKVALKVVGLGATQTAKAAIEKAGGSLQSAKAKAKPVKK